MLHHEANPQQPSTTQQDQYQEPANQQNQQQQELSKLEVAFQSVFKIIRRVYSRHLIKSLTFAWIQALQNYNCLALSPKLDNNVNLPFGPLIMKKNRTAEEEEMLDFANHCATLIQTKFRTYIAKKRHVIALNKAKRAKELLQAFVKRWKIIRIYNCEQIIIIRNKIAQLQKQIDEQQSNQQTRNSKKLKALYKYQQMQNKIFQQTFQLLLETGMWTLSKNMKPKLLTHYSQLPTRPPQPYPNPNLPPTTKTVQFSQQQQKKQNINQNIQNPIHSTDYSEFENRPIKTAGKYKVNDAELLQAQNNNIVFESNKQQPTDTDCPETDIKNKQKPKKQRQSRKKNTYDPRKAVEQAKKKKKTMNAQLLQTVTNQPIIPPSEPKQLQTPKPPEQLQQPDQTGQQKTKKAIIKKVKKQKTENDTKKPNANGSKSPLIRAKVDCWVSKKQVEPEWVKQYKIRLSEHPENPQQNEAKALHPKKSLQKIQIKTIPDIRKVVMIARPEQYPLKIDKVITEPEVIKKGEGTWEARQYREKQIENLREKQSEMAGKRKNSGDNMQDPMRMLIERKQMKKKEMHRQIGELEETYHKQYGDRLQNLMPRLKLLSVARGEEGGSRIPVIDENGAQFMEWFEQIYNSTPHFWKKTTEHQYIFRNFVSS